MRAVVFGGSGLIGSKVVDILISRGHDVIAASRRMGIDAVTGEGLEAVLADVDVVIDAMDAPAFDDAPAKAFFEKSTGNILAAAKGKPIKHYIALSVVGTPKLQISGYFQGKLKQEDLIQQSGIPYTIARATQFYEFALFIGEVATEGQVIRLPSADMQPIAGKDVAEAIANIAGGQPYNDHVDIAGPEKIRMNDFVSRALRSEGDPRQVVADEAALYVRTFPVDDSTLTPAHNVILGHLPFDAWLADAARAYK